MSFLIIVLKKDANTRIILLFPKKKKKKKDVRVYKIMLVLERMHPCPVEWWSSTIVLFPGTPEIPADHERRVRDVARMDRSREVGRRRLSRVRRETRGRGGRAAPRPARALQSARARFRREATGVQELGRAAATLEPPPPPPPPPRPPRPPRERGRGGDDGRDRGHPPHPPPGSRDGGEAEGLLRQREGRHQRDQLSCFSISGSDTPHPPDRMDRGWRRRRRRRGEESREKDIWTIYSFERMDGWMDLCFFGEDTREVFEENNDRFILFL